jgi:hypothetical protein
MPLPELLRVQDVEHLLTQVGGEVMRVEQGAERLLEPVRGHLVVDVLLVGRHVLDAAPQLDALQPETA